MARDRLKDKFKKLKKCGGECSICEYGVTKDNLNDFYLRLAPGYKPIDGDISQLTFKQAEPLLYKFDVVCKECLKIFSEWREELEDKVVFESYDDDENYYQ